MMKKAMIFFSLFLIPLLLLTSKESAQALPSTSRVSLTHDGQQANKDVLWPDVSDNGRYLVFASADDNLLPDSLPGSNFHIFLRDLQTNTLSLVSKGMGDVPANATSYYPVISGNGRYIAFASPASNLVADDTNQTTDIFVYDQVTDSMTLVSKATDGSLGNSISFEPAISDDGSVVVFQSMASNLVTGDTNAVQDIFAHDLNSGETVRVSVDHSGQQVNKQSIDPHVSGNGRYVVFTSFADLLANGQTSSAIYLYDRDTATIERISPDNGFLSNDPSHDSYISDDGRYVIYNSTDHLFVDNDTNNTYDVFRYDRDTDTTRRVSVDSSGAEANNASVSLGISGNGRYILFYSYATNLIPNDTNNKIDIFVYDGLTEETTRINIPEAGGESDNDSSGPAALSDEGQFIIYQSAAANLVANDTNNKIDVFMRDQGDIIGPLVSNLHIDPNPSTLGQPVTITATVDDTSTGGAAIASAEYRVNDGNWQPMDAADGVFDNAIEDITITLPNGLNATGSVSVCVRGQDALGNDGLAACEEATVDNAFITLTVTRITNFSIQLDDLSEPDFYVKTWIAPPDLSDTTPPTFNNEDDHTDDTASITPFWTFNNTVNQFSLRTVVIEVWDKDIDSPDDLADVNPDPNKEGVVFTIDMTTGKWSGDVNWPQSCSRGQGDDAVEVCWDISVLSETGDADGDGLLDGWEKHGFNYNSDSVIDVDLPAIGADPLHKDILVEVDYMVNSATNGISYRPMPAAIDTIVDSFNNAPVANPDGTTGIHLHVDTGPDAPLAWGTAATWGNLSQGNALPYQHHLGTCSSAIYSWQQFDQLKNANFEYARTFLFHYNIWADSLCPEKGTTSGTSRGIEASDFIVSLGSWKTPNGTQAQQAGTFMHELGHNLGLRHGGLDNEHYKPNYLSVMNYSFQTIGLLVNSKAGVFDYSRYDLPPLDETNLDENAGITVPDGLLVALGTRYYCPNGNLSQVFYSKKVDWNCNGTIGDTNVSSNINFDQGADNDTRLSVLHSQTDWDKLQYRGGAIGGLGASESVPMETVIDEITKEIAETIPPWSEPSAVYLPIIVTP